MNKTSESMSDSTNAFLRDHDYINVLQKEKNSNVNVVFESRIDLTTVLLRDHDYNITSQGRSSNASNLRFVHNVSSSATTLNYGHNERSNDDLLQYLRENNVCYNNLLDVQPVRVIANNVNQLNNISEHYLGPMTELCIHCKAKHFKAKKVSNRRNSFNDCCNHGNVFLEPLITS